MKKFLKIILMITICLYIGIFIGLHIEQWKASKKISYIKDYATNIDNIKIPESAKIIALGEATHGNKEFQELKLDVLKNVVKNNNVKAFVLEVDFGDGLLVNDYIHGNSSMTLNEVTNSLSFDIYKTKQISDLIEWMKEYNNTTNDKISFYGFDMQNPQNDTKYIINYLNSKDEYKKYDSSNTLKPLTNEYIKVNDEDTKKALKQLKLIQEEIENDQSLEYKLTYHAIDNVLKCIDYFTNTDMNDYVTFNNERDILMKDNVKFIYQLTNNNIMISGHNGHVAFKDVNYTNMGSLLKQEYNDNYYVIGTDYFNTNCNITTGSNRSNFKFNSADTLAYQARYMNNKKYFIDFTSLDTSSDMYKLVTSPIYTGDVGEGYNILMSLLPRATRKQIIPNNLYSGMIYVYNVTPLEFIK